MTELPGIFYYHDVKYEPSATPNTFTVTVAVASTTGLTPVIFDLSPGNNSNSAVSTSHSLEVPEKIDAL